MTSEILASIVISLIVGQAIKLFVYRNNYKKFNFWVLFEDGGTPSSHAVVLLALTSSLFYETGLSPISIASAVFSFIIINDALKVKRQPGMQSELMAKFIDVREIMRRKMTESIGHTPEQAFIGAILGFVITTIIYML